MWGNWAKGKIDAVILRPDDGELVFWTDREGFPRANIVPASNPVNQAWYLDVYCLRSCIYCGKPVDLPSIFLEGGDEMDEDHLCVSCAKKLIKRLERAIGKAKRTRKISVKELENYWEAWRRKNKS